MKKKVTVLNDISNKQFYIQKYLNYHKITDNGIYSLFGFMQCYGFKYFINNFINTCCFVDKSLVMDLFYDFLKKMRVIKRFGKYLKYKNKKSQIETDIYLNDLTEYPDNRKITIVCQEKLYTFTLSDLYRLMNNSLYKNEYVYCIPEKMKNPFTNIPFKKHNLYNIYFGFVFNGFSITPLIHSWFKYNFNLKQIKIIFKYELTKFAVKKYISSKKEGDVSYLLDMIYDMFKDYHSNYKYIPIHLLTCFDIIADKHDLVSLFDKQLYYYTLANHDDIHNKEIKGVYQLKFLKSMKMFFKENKNFGKYYYKKEINMLSTDNTPSTSIINRVSYSLFSRTRPIINTSRTVRQNVITTDGGSSLLTLSEIASTVSQIRRPAEPTDRRSRRRLT